MQNYKKTNVSVGIGGTLIIVIFVVLCLTVFSVLSFSAAYSDLRLTQKTEQITADYYEVHGRAEEKLSEIYNEIMNVQNDRDFNEKLLSIPEKIKDVSVTRDQVSTEPYFNVYYEAEGNKNQKICVTLRVWYSTAKNKPCYETVSWNLTNIEVPSYEDETYNLWKGFDE